MYETTTPTISLVHPRLGVAEAPQKVHLPLGPCKGVRVEPGAERATAEAHGAVLVDAVGGRRLCLEHGQDVGHERRGGRCAHVGRQVLGQDEAGLDALPRPARRSLSLLGGDGEQMIGDDAARHGRVAAVGVVDGDVKGKVIGVETNLAQLLCRHEGFQGEHLEMQVEAQNLGQKLVREQRDEQLGQGRAPDPGIVHVRMPDEVGGVRGGHGHANLLKQLRVNMGMVPGQVAVSQLLGQDLPRGLCDSPVYKGRRDPVDVAQPGAVDQLDGRHADEPPARVGRRLEQLSWLACLAADKVLVPFLGHGV
ncbi:hypothetical protein G6O67_006158 [Ophiocordyceps sinensis]|uniref:Uncharacterized protein n=1 Tax=Ophiocordyceps sinensis TaxID=72228 RepID=A0A8H4PP39_9HYPO|nr:hypothetical protein G6O67_006158 [Ophiocordyceps sinensis]